MSLKKPAEPLTCYSCHEVDAPSNCTTTAVCPSKDHVRKYFSFNKKRSHLDVNGGCCSFDKCNNQLPALIDQLPATHTTEEVQNTTVSCYQCNDIDHPGDCNTTTTCEAGKEVCASYCTRLVIISSAVENKEITDFLHQNTRYWIDAYRSDSYFDGSWVWNSTGTVINDQMYSHWRPGSHVNPNADGEHCADIGSGESSNMDTTNGYFWDHRTLSCYFCHQIDNPANCTTALDCPTTDHLCERNVNNGRRSDLSVKGGCCNIDKCNNILPSQIDLLPQMTTVMVQNTTGQTSSWTQFVANHRIYCKSKCGKLADFRSSTAILDVMSHIKSTFNHIDLWIGAAKDSHGHWIWTDNNQKISLDHTSYLNRLGGSCGAAHNSRSVSLIPHSCTTRLHPLCEAHRQ
ncbi:unnamed protein product [Mytilus coruscus]|uniref:C-type lectin domain-containing protein n=1 Tax=Mytilus coruscus TaxID=42192 RepID=A0A6J8B326_MYTCO|nr:unnamed protein product [Mytilus coruscus]